MVQNVKEISKLSEELGQFLSKSFSFERGQETSVLHKILDDILFAMNESTNITIKNHNGEILYVNEKFCQLSKYKKEEIVGKKYNNLTLGLNSRPFYENMIRTIHSGAIWKGEVKNRAKDGSIFWVYEVIVPFINEQDMPYQYICFQTDITKEKLLEQEFKTKFLETFRSLQNGIFKVKKGTNGRMYYTMVEGKLMDEIGANEENLLQRTPSEIFSDEIATIKNEMYRKAFAGQKVNYEIELNGKLIIIDLEPIFNDGIVTELVGTVHDISAFRDVQNELKVNKGRYQSLFNYSHEYIIMLDKSGTILDMSPNVMNMFHLDESSFGKVSLYSELEEEKHEAFEAIFRKAKLGEVQFIEYKLVRNQFEKYFNISLVPTLIDNRIDHIYLIAKDVSEEKVNQARNAYLAHHDELTSLPNRRWMEQSIQSALNSEQPIALLSLDLDRFKSINDTLGHPVGDGLLVQIANRLLNNITNETTFVARMGGDELMILCQSFERKQDVIDLAKEVLELLAMPFYVQGSELLITASIGIVFKPVQKSTVTELMKQVDVALYKAKESGKNMYQVYNYTMNQENYMSYILERDLRKAIINDEFLAYLQPKVDATTGETVGAEALVRWNHPTRGLISPSQFIPLAEETGLIIAIGRLMKKKVCETLIEWRNNGKRLVPISVNISSKRFLQDGFVEEIRDLLKGFQLKGELLEIEITENSIMRNEKNVQRTLKQLKEMGVKIYIDDFGTGYSSFNYLKSFLLHGVKIDQSFIRNIENEPENASITSAMIKMAQSLNLEVVAEGVETQEELDFLVNENCRFIQGYFYGKPCLPNEFEENYLQNYRI